jgi:predicted Zn-dependent protease with MMP-like domain
MADETAVSPLVSPFAYQILGAFTDCVGKVVISTFTLENAIVFLYNDESALIVGTMSYDQGESTNAVVIVEEKLFEYFEATNLAKVGLLSKAYVIQEIGKKMGLDITPDTENGDAYRIDYSPNNVKL